MNFIYVVEGEPYVGPLQAWVDAVEDAHYSDLAVSNEVWCVDREGRIVAYIPQRVSSATYDDINTSEWVVEVDGETYTARMRIDLRA